MTNFPFNLLSSAQQVIGMQEYLYKQFIGREVNEAGYMVDKYAEPVLKKANIQPMSNTQYIDHHLDFAKSYIRIYSTDNIYGLDRENNADEIIYEGYVYHVVPNIDFMPTGNWNCVVAVRVQKYDG